MAKIADLYPGIQRLAKEEFERWSRLLGAELTIKSVEKDDYLDLAVALSEAVPCEDLALKNTVESWELKLVFAPAKTATEVWIRAEQRLYMHEGAQGMALKRNDKPAASMQIEIRTRTV